MKRSSLIIIIICFFMFFLSACSFSRPEDTQYRYREERSELPEENIPLPEFSEEYGALYDYCRNSDGDLYFLYRKETEQGGKYSVISYHSQEDAYEVLPMNPEDNPAVCAIRVSPEGDILLFDTVRAYVYKKTSVLPERDFSAWPFGGVLFTDNGTVICQTGGDSPYYVFDLHTGEKTATFLERDFLLEKGKCRPFLDGPAGKELLVTGAGIYEHQKNSWVLRVPSDRTSLAKPDFSIRKIGKEEDGVYYVCDRNWKYRYIQEATDGGVPKITIKVTAWQDRSTLKNALAEYQIANPDITIDYRFQCVDLPASAQEMQTLLQKLTAEFSSQDAADLYVLDHLPWESWQEKGYLMDISALIRDYAIDEDYFGNVLTAYGTEEGQYVVPWFFTGGMVVCREDMADSVKDVFRFAAYLEEHPEEPGLVPYYFKDRPDLFFALMYDFYGQDIIKGDQPPEEERIRRYLQALHVIYQRLQENPEATLPEYRKGYWDIAGSPSMEDSFLLLEKKEGNVSLVPFTPMGGADCLTQALHHPGYAIVPVGGIHSRFLLGIHAASEEKEETGRLLKFLLSYFREYGNTDQSLTLFGFLPGIPVYKPSFTDRFQTPVSGGEEIGETYEIPLFDSTCTVYYTSPEDGRKIINLLEKLHCPSPQADALSNQIYAVIEERGLGYFTGEKGLEDTVNDIYQGLMLFYDERE